LIIWYSDIKKWFLKRGIAFSVSLSVPISFIVDKIKKK